MSAPNLWIRTPLFVLALALGALNWSTASVSSQPDGGEGLHPYDIPLSTFRALPLSPTELGHVDLQVIVRAPSGG